MIPPPRTSTLSPYPTLSRPHNRLHRHWCSCLPGCRFARWNLGRLCLDNCHEVLSMQLIPCPSCHGTELLGVANTNGMVAIRDRKSTRLNSSHGYISYAVFCL